MGEEFVTWESEQALGQQGEGHQALKMRREYALLTKFSDAGFENPKQKPSGMTSGLYFGYNVPQGLLATTNQRKLGSPFSFHKTFSVL